MVDRDGIYYLHRNCRRVEDEAQLDLIYTIRESYNVLDTHDPRTAFQVALTSSCVREVNWPLRAVMTPPVNGAKCLCMTTDQFFHAALNGPSATPPASQPLVQPDRHAAM